MPILSALDCISPAFARTKLVLFSPFRFGRTWKLSATAYLGTASTAFVPFACIYLLFIPMLRHQPNMPAFAASALIAFIVVFTLVTVVFFYLFTRLRFVSFDITLNSTLNQGQFVAPAWSKYGSQTLKWTLCKLLLGSAFFAAIALPVAHIAKGLFGTFSGFDIKPGAPPSPELMSAIFSAYAAFFLIYFFFALFFFVSSLLSDFVIPSLALEDTTLAEAFRRLGLLIKHEPGQFSLYALLKLGLGIVCYFGATLAFEIVVVLLALIVGGVAFLLGYLLHLAGVPQGLLFGLGIFLAVVFYLVVVFWGFFIVIGGVLTFLEAYTLYFLSGRYPLLGEQLTASTPPPTAPQLYPHPYPPYVPPASAS